ncbi:MAG: cyclic nucleotide-regulated small mechanosensitive ion channel [Gallionellaceae bacterium]|nr:MAG: cyclic nucleotide-regulated small mechanosensitive ion channel [Gallionellaceae bacterium]
MNFWSNTLHYFWREESLAVLTMVVSIAVLLFHLRREERKSLINTLAFFAACMFGQFVSSLLHTLEFARAAEVLHEVFVIGAGIAVIRLWGELVFRIVLPLVKLSPPRITEDIIVIIAYIAWGMVRLRYAGLDLGSIVATSAMITAVVAFAMQDTLGNILGGLALQLDNSIEIGDWIKVDDISGQVVDIRWRSTLVETRNWETVVFPNSQLMKNKFVVLGRRTDQPVQWRRWVWFSVSMEVLPARVINAVEESILQTEVANVAKSPPPNCVLMDFDSRGFARYALRYWLTDLMVDDPTDAAMRWQIATALQRVGIKLALEEHSLRITKENEKYEEGVHHREVLLRVKTLRKVELFSQMTDEELKVLAERLKYSPFAMGNIITRQGDRKSHWLHIIISGEAEVYLEPPGGGKRVIRSLGKGSFFGEMGLMTGAPRSATVVAKTDVECYRLDKEMFEEILHARPVIAEEMSRILASRRAELDSALLDMDAASAQMAISQQSGEILATIKRFFGLG